VTVIVSARRLDARACAAWLRRFAATTPGVVVSIAFAVAASCIAAGLVCGAQLNGRIGEHRAVLERSEPFAYSAQNLYAALSSADAAAAAAFLSGGIQTSAMRGQYQQALAAAASALADATAGATDANTRRQIAEISAQLATYTGLVETARANNLQKFPIGSAYLREASSLMQNQLLPGAERMYTSDMATVKQDQSDVGSTPIAALVLLVLALVVIVAGSMVMLARTNRRFNLGLVAAAAAVLLAIAWVVTASQLAANDIERARTENTARFEQLAQARILAQQARTDETLQLIARGDITASEKAFRDHVDGLLAALGPGQSAATDAVRAWVASHEKQVALYLGGDYRAAVAQAIGSDPAASAAQFSVVESSLRDAIEQTRTTVRERVSTAGGFLAWSPTGTLLLTVVAACAAVVGLWPRLEEFL
jgi:hypothetical protein